MVSYNYTRNISKENQFRYIRYSVWKVTYVLKKIPGIEPWGTPCLTNPHPQEVVLEYLLSTRALWYLSFR